MLGIVLRRTVHIGGPATTIGNLVYTKTKFWMSQRQAAKALGVSPNVLSKYLSGKLPKLYL